MANPVKIAIVDDDQSVRESLLGLVESVGYDVAVFSSAEECLNVTDLNQFACLILDVRLPGMCGLELHSKLRTKVPTVFITAHRDGGAQSLAFAQGAKAFLYKPFKPDALLEAVRIAVADAKDCPSLQEET